MLYTPFVLMSNCFLERPIDLGEGVRAHPLRDDLGFRGEIDYLLSLDSLLEVEPFTRQFKSSLIAVVGDAQPMSIVEFPEIDAPNAPDAESRLRDVLIRAAGALSILTANPIEPVAIILRRGTEAGIRPLPPQWSRIQSFGSFDESIRDTFAATGTDARIRLMVQIMREALRVVIDLQGEYLPGYDSRILHYVQLFDVAGREFDDDGLWGSPEENTFANRLRRQAKEVGHEARFTTLPAGLDVSVPDALDFVDAIRGVRNAIVHDGELELAQSKWIRSFAQHRPALELELRELAREFIMLLAHKHRAAA